MRGNSFETIKRDIEVLFKIFVSFNRKTPTYKIAKKIFGVEDYYEIKKCEGYLKRLFERWAKEGIVYKETVDGVSYYSIDPTKIIIGKAKVEMKVGKKKEVVKIDKCVGLRTNSGWVIFEWKQNVG